MLECSFMSIFSHYMTRKEKYNDKGQIKVVLLLVNTDDNTMFSNTHILVKSIGRVSDS